MSLNEPVLKRFAELEAQGLELPVKRTPPGNGSDTIDPEAFQHWASSAMHLVASVFGEKSPHYRNLEAAHRAFRGYEYEVRPMRGVFLAAKSDYDGGYLFTLQAA